MLKYFLPLSRGSAWLLTLLLLGVSAIFSLAGPSLLQHGGTKHALLAYADQAGADALYLFPCDPGEFWQTMITLTNLENRKVEVDPFCYHRNGDFLGNSPSIERLQAEGTQTIKAEEIGVPGCQTFTLEADGKMVGALLLTSLDGKKSEAIPAMHKSAKQLDFPPLLEGDTEDKKITLLNPGFSSVNLEVIALDPDGGQLEQTFLPPLSSRESRTFAVKDLFSPESLYQLSTVRVISDNRIVGLQLVDSTPGDLLGLPALTSTSHKWSFPILTMGGDVELWTTVGLFNPGEVSAFVSIEAFDAEDASLGIIETTAFFPGAIYDLHTANMEGIIPQETAVLKVTADEPIIGYTVIGAVEGRGVTATLGIPAEDQMVAGFEIIGSADGSVLEAFPMIMTKNGVLKSTAENLGEEELRQNIEIKTRALVQTLQKNKGATTTDQESTAGFEETGAHVQDEDGEVFVGNSPPVPDSGATLTFKEDIVNEQEFSWTSSDPILGDIDTGGFVPATTWRLLGNNPTRLVFVGSGDGATFYGNVLFEPYNRAVVDVVKGRKRVRYLLKVADLDLEVQHVPDEIEEGSFGDPFTGGLIFINNDRNDPENETQYPDYGSNTADFNDLADASEDDDLIYVKVNVHGIPGVTVQIQVQVVQGEDKIQLWETVNGVTPSSLVEYTGDPKTVTVSDESDELLLIMEGKNASDLLNDVRLVATFNIGENSDPISQDIVTMTVNDIRNVNRQGEEVGEYTTPIPSEVLEPFSHEPGKPGGPGGFGGPPEGSGMTFLMDPYRIVDFVHTVNPDGPDTVTLTLVSNVAEDWTRDYELVEKDPNRYGNDEDFLALEILEEDPTDVMTIEKKVIEIASTEFGIIREMELFETEAASDTFRSRRLQLVVTMDALPDPSVEDTLEATVTSSLLPGEEHNEELTETGPDTYEFQSEDGTLKLVFIRFGDDEEWRGAYDVDYFTAKVTSDPLDIDEEPVDAIETAESSLEFRTDALHNNNGGEVSTGAYIAIGQKIVWFSEVEKAKTPPGTKAIKASLWYRPQGGGLFAYRLGGRNNGIANLKDSDFQFNLQTKRLVYPLLILEAKDNNRDAIFEDNVVKCYLKPGDELWVNLEPAEKGWGCIKRTVVKVDLEAKDMVIDNPSNDRGVPETEEDAPGAFIHFNVDNDNLNGNPSVPDYTEIGPVEQAGGTPGSVDENDLKPLKAVFEPITLTSGKIVLSRSNANIQVWTSSKKGAAAALLTGGTYNGATEGNGRKTWNLPGDVAGFNSVKNSMWVEGRADGSGVITLAYYDAAGNLICSDTVKYTFLAAVCGTQPDPDPGHPHRRLVAQSLYPNLVHCEWSILDNVLRDNTYNCIAFSVGITNKWIDDEVDLPATGGNGNGVVEVVDFVAFYNHHGYDPTPNRANADIMLYYGGPNNYHAARKRFAAACTCGAGKWDMWKCKRGRYEAIEFRGEQMDGGSYGNPTHFFKKR